MIRTLCLALIATLPFSAPVGAMTTLTIGTGSISGVYYLAGGALCRIVNRERSTTSYRCVVESTGGSIANVQALTAGDLDFALVQSDVTYRAGQGAAPFDGAPVANLRVVMHLYDEALTIVARPEPGLDFLTDFRGRRLNIGNPGSGTRVSLGMLSDALGIPANGFATLTELDPANHGRGLCDGEIDGFAYQIGHPSENILAATTRCQVRLLSARPDSIATLTRQLPFFKAATIPGGLYPNNPNDVVTLGVTAQLVTRADADDGAVRRIVDAVLDNAAEFSGLHPALSKLKPVDLAYRSPFLPFHPAAAAAFRARGLGE